MKNKEIYILNQIENIMSNDKISGKKRKIKKLRNLSDEDYEKILNKKELEAKEELELNNAIQKYCNEHGLTLEEFDNLIV